MNTLLGAPSRTTLRETEAGAHWQGERQSHGPKLVPAQRVAAKIAAYFVGRLGHIRDIDLRRPPRMRQSWLATHTRFILLGTLSLQRRQMHMEVHIHGSIFLCKGVRLTQVEQALRPWLEYLDVDTLAEAKSLEREEPGLAFDTRERTLNICWTGDVGRNFHDKLTEAFGNIGQLTEYASEVEVTYYPEHADDEFYQMFVGPSPEAIHEFRRQCVVEDISGILTRHVGPEGVSQVVSLVNKLFEHELKQRRASGATTAESSSTVIPLHPRGKHLH